MAYEPEMAAYQPCADAQLFSGVVCVLYGAVLASVLVELKDALLFVFPYFA